MKLPGFAPALLPPRQFATRRLHARLPRAEDAADVLAAYAGDAVATRYLAWKPYTAVAPLAAYLAGRAQAWERPDGHFAYLLCLRGEDRPIGSIGVFVDEPKVMFGYVLARAHWGRGYAAEALGWLMGWAMAEPRIRRMWAYCAAENTSSARVMTKVGMECESLLSRWQVFPNLGPEPQDCLLYARSKPDPVATTAAA